MQKKCKVIIHGASGFLGRRFIKTLSATDNMVVAIARETSDLRGIEEGANTVVLRYKKSLEELLAYPSENLRGATFYELAWHGVFGANRNDPEQYTVNIPLVISSVTFAHHINAKHWIGIGSQAEYGNLNKMISEQDQCAPTTLYGKSKLICSRIADDLCARLDMDYSWLRLFSVYGPDDNHQWLIHLLIKAMLRNEPIDTTLGEQSWDYLYVDDAVNVLLMLAKHKGLGIANLASGKSILIKDIVKKIKKLTNSRSVINFGAIDYRDDQVMYMKADISKISNQLGWHPTTEIESGLSNTIEYHRRNMQASLNE